MADDEAKKAKQAEIDRKRAEVRKRMEEASKAKKAKKGFMTPERKKKLRLLLRKKAAEELKKEQERKAAERRRIIEERCGKPKNVEDANEDALVRVCKEYHTRIGQLEDEKFDLEYIVKRKDMELRLRFDSTSRRSPCRVHYTASTQIRETDFEATKIIQNLKCDCFSLAELQTICQMYWHRIYNLEGDKYELERAIEIRKMEISDLNSQVNDLRGKFVKPTLKKVSKYENKFAKLQKKAAEFNFRNQLKVVKKKEFTLEEEDKEKKPDWSKGKPGDQKVKEEEVEA
uniref:SFRICE_020519 n=1 Tax=Spodoptera frugiperda TaxID=7108 RepID=A0A2H1VZJ2_SPOFR